MAEPALPSLSMKPIGWFYLLPLIAAIVSFVMMAWVIGSRWDYPYQLDWIEGSVLHHVVRITEGKPVYQWPDMTYAPALYTPLYYYLSASFAAVLGKGLPALRLVSVLATIGSCFCITCITWQLTRSKLSTALALFLVAMPFRFTGFWFDVARVDSLWAFFLLATVCALVFTGRNPRDNRAVILAALLATCAVFTKQTSLFMMPFFAITCLLWGSIRSAILFTLVSAGLILLTGMYFQWQSNGLFYFITMEMADNHNMTRGIPNHFFKGDLLESVPVFLLFMTYWLIHCCRKSLRTGLGWVLIVVAISGMTLLARMYAGGFKNVTMPMHFMIVALAVAGFSVSLEALLKSTSRNWFLFPVLFSFLLLMNIVWSFYVPQWFVPNAVDRAYGDALVQKIAAVPGRVCLSRDAYLSYLAGKEFCAHETQLTDILNGDNKAIAESVIADANKRIMEGYYQVLIVDSLTDLGNYVDVRKIPYAGTPLDLVERNNVFYPINGGPRPHLWLDLWAERARRTVPE